MQRFALAAALTAFLFIPATAWATPVVIAQIDSGSGLAGNGTANAEGESIALGAAPLGLIGWDDIEFNWYTWSGGTVPTNSNLVPLASGNVFILTQLYTGTPTALSSSTAGFVAESTGIVADGSGEAYTFAANVTLLADTTYYFYSSAAEANPVVQFPYAGIDQRYRSFGSPLGPYLGPNGSTNLFDLTGIPVPEPATWTMFLIGFGTIGFVMLRTRRNVVGQSA